MALEARKVASKMLIFVFGRGASPPWSPHQGSALDPLGALGGPQTPRL